ncbi:hypothetical protein F4808DRAFT_237647 [Astrocystis sublimbata]|nr:hypothetical protein F4808DRAFT_237647 [Astrocystis sublimbata]
MDTDHISKEAPPPYSAYAGSHVLASPNAQEVPMTSHLQRHLTSLPNRIRMNREAHSTQQSFDDASLLDLLLPEIDDFLAYLGGLHNSPKLARLTLVPEVAVAKNAQLSGLEDMRARGEICRVVRVQSSSDEKKSKTARHSDKDNTTSDQGASPDQEWSAGNEFSDWGRFGDSSSHTNPSQTHNILWWKDEEMAHRLARHLQPPTEPAPLQTPVQATVEEQLPAQKPKKGWFWGRKGSASSGNNSSFATKSVQANMEPLPRTNLVARTPNAGPEQAGTGARMNVTAEEVAFRVENDMGIMESASGWAVVVLVHI